ncbi:MAG TPA: mandelate racemase/muconate lactonizing enzyme family protein [Rhodothermales bacterium]|nr:mandelate racemase/muconate lactonizing enzyme family protein [Rhodothermales bacterium]
MIIRQITAFEVVVPAKPGMIQGKGIDKPLHKLPVGVKEGWTIQFDQVPFIVLKMELDDGIVGWGELYRGHSWTTVEEMATLLLGRSIDSLSLQKLPFAYSREYDGFECAVYDACAKVHGMRVADLLGGPVRDKVRVGAWSSHRNLDEIGPLVAEFAEAGFDCVKFKCDLEDDVVGWCSEIRKAAPGMEVILDPNERWLYPGEARKRIDGLAEIGNILCLEDPLPRWMLHEYKRLRDYGPVPIALHVSLPYILHGQRVEDAVKAIRMDAVDGFNFNGGAARFAQLAGIADAAGLPCWHGSEANLGILEARYLHSSAAAATCIWPGDTFGRLIREHDLLQDALRIEPPFAYLPEGLGLGVTPDEDAIAHYQIAKKTFKA